MSQLAQSILLTILILSTSVWVGGYVAIVVVARTTTTTLDSASRIAFFRSFGRSYFWIGCPALLVALITGGLLLRGRELDALVICTIVLAVVLLALFALAVVQARRMTTLRTRAVEHSDDEHVAMRVRRGGRTAGILRAVLGVLSLVLVVLGSFLAT